MIELSSFQLDKMNQNRLDFGILLNIEEDHLDYHGDFKSYKLAKENNIKILGVNFKDKKINALKFLKDLGDPYEYLTRDSNGKQSVNFGIYGIPESILIDNKLTIIKKFVGPLTKQDLNNIKEIILILQFSF